MNDNFKIIQEALADQRYNNTQPNLGKSWKAKEAIAALARIKEEYDALHKVANAARPFAEYYRWRMTKGMKVGPPAMGPKQIAALAEALDPIYYLDQDELSLLDEQ